MLILFGEQLAFSDFEIRLRAISLFDRSVSRRAQCLPPRGGRSA
jgi:hypothetical protein